MPEWDWSPYYPAGTIQSKVIDGALADRMAFWGQIGHHGSDFIAGDFLKEHPEYEWMRTAQGHEMRALDPLRVQRAITITFEAYTRCHGSLGQRLTVPCQIDTSTPTGRLSFMTTAARAICAISA